MERLLEGYRRFRAQVWPQERDRYRVLAVRGQQPETLVISCSDSRVDPEAIFGAGPGELFVVRNVAALVPPFHPDGLHHSTSAALEFGVRVLKVTRVVVLGHAQCGGVQAMVEGAPAEARDFVEPWISIARPVLQGVPPTLQGPEILTHCEGEVVRLSLSNLLTFPWIRDAAASGRLQLHGFRFDIRTGILLHLQGDSFVPVE